MITTDKKLQFVELRANNLSLSSIGRELHVSRATCSKLDKELKIDIEAKKAERNTEINELYTMTRNHRINRLQAVLERLDKAIINADFSQMSTETLLKMKLRYESELSKEYPVKDDKGLLEYSYKSIFDRINDLNRKYESGEISTEQLKSGLTALDMMIKAISKNEVIWN